jgi:glycogen synthase
MTANNAQYFFTRAQHYFERARKADDAEQKKIFETVATELWLKATTTGNPQVLLNGRPTRRG